MKLLKKLKKYRRIFYLLIIIVVVVAFFVSQSQSNNEICSDIQVIVLDSMEGRFLSKSIIIDHIYKNYKQDIVGNKYKNIDLSKIEEVIGKNYFVDNVDVYRSSNGNLTIKVTQRKPIARIFDKKNQSFYIGSEGYLLPISHEFASYVPIFSGNISSFDSLFSGHRYHISDLDSNNYDDLYNLSQYLNKNQFTKSLIDQVNVDTSGKFDFIPKVGNIIIHFGTISNYQTKIRNLKAFYTTIAPKEGWDKYKAINLEYTNQIVCIK